MANQNKQNQEDIKKLLKDQNLLLSEQIRILQDQAGISGESLSDQQDISNVLKDQLKNIQFQKEERKLINSTVNNLNSIASKNYKIGKDELGTLKGIQQLQKDRVSIENNIRLLNQQKKKFAQESKTASQEEKQIFSDITISLNEQVKEAINLKKELGKVEASSKKINKNFGSKTFEGLSDLTSKIPGLSKLSGPFKEAADSSRSMASGIEQAMNMDGRKLTKNKIKELGLQKELNGLEGKAARTKLRGMKSSKKGMLALKSGFKALGPILSKALGPIGLLVELVQALIQGDKAAGDLAKSMNMTYTDAVRLRGEFGKMAADSGSIFVNTKGLQETYMAINKTLGTNAKISEDVLVQFTELREASGLTNEELTGIFKITQGTNKELNQVTGEVLAQAKISSANLGVTINEKEVLRDINKLSAATTLSLGKNPAILSKTVTTAKALGMTMEQIASSSESLLNFEQSIASELKAELLLGKNINLERARLAALNNDIATVAEEISSQIGSAADFGKMNVIQQKALAESVGMSRDSLAETLFVQEQLRNVTGDEAEERKAVLDSLIQEKGLAEAQRQLAKGSIEDLKSQASIQDRFNKTMDKLREIFVQLAEPILQILSPVMDILAPILGVVSKMMQPLMLLLRAVGNILGPLLDFSSIGDNWMEGVGKGFGAAGQNMMDGGALALLGPYGAVGYAAATSMDDGISTHGKRTLITPKGAFALNNNDTVIAGTNLFRGNDVYSGPEGAISVGADNKLLKELLEETKKANNTRREIGNKTVGALDEQGRRQIYSS